MKENIAAVVLLLGSYAFVRMLMELYYRKWKPSWLPVAGGIASWCVVIALGNCAFEFVHYVGKILVHPSTSTAFLSLGIVALYAGLMQLAFGHGDILDMSRWVPFFKLSLSFRNYTRERRDIFAAVEDQTIRQIHKEQTGKDLVFAEPERRAKRSLTTDEAMKELEEHRKKTLQSPLMNEELAALREGGFVDATETFKLNALKRRSHVWYDCVQGVRVDASAATLTFDVHIPWKTKELAADAGKLHLAKEKTFELVRFVWLEPWLKPFKEFVQSVAVVCHTGSEDDFGMTKHAPFMRVDIPASELRNRDGRSYYPPELEPLSKISFENIEHRPPS